MALAKDTDAYKALANIVGSEHITSDPVMLDTYTWQWLGDLVGERANSFMPIRPEAVVLPGSTQEVQAVVKVCNRYGLKFKAHSTGWIYSACPNSEGVIVLDLRRMNRILEVNTKDMYAVVEPYVSYAQLQPEIMRKGLNCEVNSAGSNCSALAQATAGFGAGYGNYMNGYGPEILLGVEWVLPDGEVLRMGSLGAGCGWISPEGPGPGLKGALRGAIGNLGGCGVFTACAIKLYNWPGPPELEMENIQPGVIKIKNFPENLEVRYVYFDDYESRHRALTAIGEEDIGYTVGFAARGMAVFALGDTNMEAVALRENLYDVLPSIAFIMILAANSSREFEYERKVLDRILEETGGKALGMLGEEPFRDVMVTHLLKVGSLPAHGMCGRTGAFLCAPSTTILTSRLATPMEEIAIEQKKKYIATGQLADDGGEGMWGVPFNHYHEIYIENICAWDPTDRESGQGHLDLQEDINRESLRKCRYLSALGAWVEEIGKMDEEDFERLSSFSPSDLITKGRELAKLHSPYDARIGPLLGDCHIWLRKIRAQLDPNGAGDATPV